MFRGEGGGASRPPIHSNGSWDVQKTAHRVVQWGWATYFTFFRCFLYVFFLFWCWPFWNCLIIIVSKVALLYYYFFSVLKNGTEQSISGPMAKCGSNGLKPLCPVLYRPPDKWARWMSVYTFINKTRCAGRNGWTRAYSGKSTMWLNTVYGMEKTIPKTEMVRREETYVRTTFI